MRYLKKSILIQGNTSCKLNCQDSEIIDCQDSEIIDCQEHILSCRRLISSLSIEQQVTIKEIIYFDIFCCTENQRKFVQIYITLQEIRDETLESLPTGNDIGPSIAVTFI